MIRLVIGKHKKCPRCESKNFIIENKTLSYGGGLGRVKHPRESRIIRMATCKNCGHIFALADDKSEKDTG
jgi:predicted nucleic-acid-binding Zn-ribbon protein